MTFDDSAERFEADFPSFDVSFAVTYEDALRLVREHLSSYEPAALPELLERCADLKLAIATEQLHQVYYGPLVKQENKLIQSLLGIFGYQARLLGFDVGPIWGKTRYMLFLKKKGRLDRFIAVQMRVAAFIKGIFWYNVLCIFMLKYTLTR